MKVNWNLALVCIIALLCIAAVAITGLSCGHDGTIISLAFTALGAIPAGLIAWGVARTQNKSETKEKKEGE